MTESAPIRLVLAESREILRKGLAAMLNSQPGLRIIGEAQDGAETLQLCEMVQPDVVLLSTQMPDMDSAYLVSAVRERWPRIGLLVIAGPGEVEFVESAEAAGAAGYIPLHISTAELVEALEHTVRGERPAAPESARMILCAEHLGRLEEEMRSDKLDLNEIGDPLGRRLPLIFPDWQIRVRLYPNRDLFAYPPHSNPFLTDSTWRWLRTQERPVGFGPGDPYPWTGEPNSVHSLILAPVPAPAGGQALGGICLVRRGASEDLDELLPIVHSVASILSGALKRVQEQDDRFPHVTTAQELQMAGRIQAGILPERPPALRGWELAARLVPARETSGDFYDFIPLPNGHWGIGIADVTDKGLGAAVFMALASTLLRTYAVQYYTLPAFAMSSVNERILSDTRGSMFVTAFYGVLEPETGRLRYVNAGHNPPYVLSAQKGKPVDRLFRTGMALGILKEASWQQKIVKLIPGDMLVLYTDGITEAQNRRGEMFGERRLLDVIRPLVGRPAREILEAVLGEVESFSGGSLYQDDTTLVVLARRS